MNEPIQADVEVVDFTIQVKAVMGVKMISAGDEYNGKISKRNRRIKYPQLASYSKIVVKLLPEDIDKFYLPCAVMLDNAEHFAVVGIDKLNNHLELISFGNPTHEFNLSKKHKMVLFGMMAMEGSEKPSVR